MRNFLCFCLLVCAATVSAQKIVFEEGYSFKNVSVKGGYLDPGKAAIVEDSITKEKMLMIGAKKEFLFYLFDPNWKLVQKFTTPHDESSNLEYPLVEVIYFTHNGAKWNFILSGRDGYSNETVDFGAKTARVNGRYAADIAKNFMDEKFYDGDDYNIMYLNKNGLITVNKLSKDLTSKTVKFNMTTQLPMDKSKKYTTEELYTQLTEMNSALAGSAYFTRHKVHFNVQKNSYAVLVFGDEPVAELTLYDKETGKNLKTEVFSVENLVPKEIKNFNTAALLYDNKIHLLAAYKTGGVYAAFDADTKKMLYSFVYSEKDKTSPFNYGPVTYETLPATNRDVLKEKLENISMDKFCSELYKHSCAITAKIFNGNTVISLANFDLKELIAPTAANRSGVNTMTSPNWFVSTAAGFMFEPGSLRPSTQSLTWNELNKSDAGSKYEKVAPAPRSEEYMSKKATIMDQAIVNRKLYTVYLYKTDLKIFEQSF